MHAPMRSTAPRMGAIGLVLFLAWTSAGCRSSSATTQPPTTPANANTAKDDETAGLIEHHRYHHHGGVTLFIAMSLDTLGASPEQRASVEKIRADLRTKMEPAHAAEQNLLGTLADGLVAGKLDTSKLNDAIARMTASAAAAHDASIDALNALHAVLTPPERAALVDKVESHWAVWQNANADETGTGQRDADRLTLLAADLALTPEQVDKIRLALDEETKRAPRLDSQEIATHLRAFGDAFRGEQFDAKALTTAGSANAHLVGWGALQMVRLVQSAVPVLTPDQRGALAQRLREHANDDPSAQGSP